MARYVAVSTDSTDKTVQAGPLELDDPSQYTAEDGTVLMSEEQALAQGYQYADDDEAGQTQAQEPSGDAAAVEGVQGPEDGQGAQTQPGVPSHQE